MSCVTSSSSNTMASEVCRGAHTVNTVPSGTTRAPRSRSSTTSRARSVLAIVTRLRRRRLEALQAAQHFSHAPRLCHAASRRKRRGAVEDLADRPDAGVIQMAREPLQQRQRIAFAAWVHAQPGIEERTNQLGSDGFLVVRRIVRVKVVKVLCFEYWIVRCECS